MRNSLNRSLYEWVQIGTNESVRQWIWHGVTFPFKWDPPQFILHDNVTLSASDIEFIDEKIVTLLSKSCIRQCSIEEIHCVSPLKCIAKKHGKKRLLINLHRLNQCIETKKFKYEGVDSVAEQIQPGDYLYSVDLQDGFFHVPVHRDFQKYLGFCWRGQYYVWCVLPQGLACSPYYFYKILRPVVQYLRENNLRINLWVDDFLLMCQPGVATDHKDLLLNTLHDLGWSVNYEKSDLTDSTVCTYIGYDIDSSGPDGLPWLQVTRKRIVKLKKDIKRCLSSERISVRRVACIAGQCISMVKAILPAKLLLQNIYKVISNRESWDSLISLPPGVTSELRWWQQALDTWNGASFQVKTFDCQTETDASGTGWGACMEDKQASGVWTSWVSHMPSNFRELLAVGQAIQSFGPLIQDRSVQVLSDNITTVACINHLYSPSSQLGRLAQSVWVEAQKWNVEPSRIHEYASRVTSPYEWRLNPYTFSKLERHWGPHTIDRCASVMTTQLPRYNSLYHDPLSEGVDCLAQTDWEYHNNYINPPFWLIPKILILVKRQRALATIIAPLWPAQHWFQDLMDMVIDWPIHIPNTLKVIQQVIHCSSRTTKECELETACLENIWSDRVKCKGWNTRLQHQLPYCWAKSTLELYNRLIKNCNCFVKTWGLLSLRQNHVF